MPDTGATNNGGRRGRELRLARCRAGLTRAQLADMVGCSYPSLSNIEQGAVPRRSRVLDAAFVALDKLNDEPPGVESPAAFPFAEFQADARALGLGSAEQLVAFLALKGDAAALWAKLLQLYERNAHGALGYPSWHAYCAEEFDLGQSHAYRLVDAGRVAETLEEQSPMGDSLPSERAARELVPLRDEPEKLRDAWSEAVESNGSSPTAAQVREVVARKRPKKRRGRSRVVEMPSQWLPDLLEGGDADLHVLRTQTVEWCVQAVRLNELLDDGNTLQARFEGDQQALLNGLETVEATAKKLKGVLTDGNPPGDERHGAELTA